MENTLKKKTRKFVDYETFNLNDTINYHLMPFKFHRLNNGKELIVNEVGDYLVVEDGTVNKIVNRKINKVDDLDLYADLVSNFFISEEKISPLIDVLATRYRTKKHFLNYFTGLHIFVVSLRCEHTCQYCQVSRVTQDKDKFDMSYEYLDKGIDIMFKSPNPHLTMEFQGGEALLAFDKIQYSVLKAKRIAEEKERKLTIVICTNLAIVNDEILMFCKEHNILISTSLDGPKFIHDKNRHKPHASSYDLTIQGINKAREILGEDQVSALMTTTTLSLDYPKEIVDEYINMGFEGIFLRNISPYGFALRSKTSKYDTEKFLEFYKIALDHILEYNFQGKNFREDLASIFLTKILTPFNVGYVDLQSPAGLITGVIVFNYDGDVFATDESRMLAEQKDYTFKLGTLNNSYEDIFFGEKVEKITEVWANEGLTGCSECALQSYCGADPVHNHATQGNMYGYRPTSDFCKKNMAIITYLIELMESNQEVKKIFESWIRF
ncbi:MULTISPECIES: His-Xaa-Ser system radical SAM maturase HxsB [Empedobacter]|uniref:His-Xaa-Ser system radical SAM maturase HxsB n=1 Tax=Empedobacter falsenii TaxID=343874 RepID=A0A3R8TMT2_9FLAO|nr:MULTISPECIES: His-Xaa-Ser system radical SAM maturase HxsB [Empedobacter]RRT86490.1 His-Xaa-Ser system radical SAM maturase HxsB [Empedobacter falsenii]RRT87852.1 His-Xaa-Ser system radical SAM maturase HxsB [Empedobacter falsenii]